MRRACGIILPERPVLLEAGENGQVAVKVIDDRGNELLVVQNLKEAAR
jgi:hypothetical protein